MRQENVVKEKRRLGNLKKYFYPARVVNLCFVIVVVCSTILTWREVIVLEGAYVASQRSMLENVSNALDRHMQVGVDRLLFFRNGMQSALQTPLTLDVMRNVQNGFEQQRRLPQWDIKLDNRRTLPLYGVSEFFVDQSELLNRDHPLLHNELTAAMELGYLFRLSANGGMLPRRAYYVSRAGFFVATYPLENNQQIIPTYYHLLMRPWFTGQSEHENRSRTVRWFTDQADGGKSDKGFVIASVPLDYEDYWFGVLAMSFPVEAIAQQLKDAQEGQNKGEYQLYNSQFQLLTLAPGVSHTEPVFNAEQHARLAQGMAQDTRGGLRFGTRYVSWQKLRHFDGFMLRIQTLREGLQGDFGSISVALALLWVLFTAMLLFAWAVIRRMVNNMYSMQNTLQWQAWYDPLTRLCNRGALFERAKILTEEARVSQQPFAVIQIDLDHFKNVNDRYGHQAGDLVLSHAAGLISSTISSEDVAGRVGGEEFCVLLPCSTLEQAVRVAERIRARIRGKEILVHKHTTIRISASLGVSGALESGSYDFETLQSIADSRLYRAKNSGRNQVCSEDAAPKPKK
ncbi:cellulose biosynthesis regulator diguanylate cyclase DgcQ [Kosakonia oryzendophytica]|uniref:cellulose biosynthesis regulator diguanylate cyclase DgcQ n=1 Tax=Kosakonia oryzendophytica TaxID=1005665 RepID=UPI00077731A8